MFGKREGRLVRRYSARKSPTFEPLTARTISGTRGCTLGQLPLGRTVIAIRRSEIRCGYFQFRSPRRRRRDRRRRDADANWRALASLGRLAGWNPVRERQTGQTGKRLGYSGPSHNSIR